ncbi:hypothetical protein [Paenibacillus sp. YYML68]|uniref:hypothetical protein n=1 Tax=Paenibacillus sp. YYML68 TaxID=2909250 RepID=UPI0024911029|nr:hypothetical protein [Paenibacillus sp. YYML68]
MPDFSNDRLCGVTSLQNFSGIRCNLNLPNAIEIGDDYFGMQKNTDYVNFYLIHNAYVECGVSYSYKNTTSPHWRVFMNTGAFYYTADTGLGHGDYDNPHWMTKFIEEVGLNFGLGSTISLELLPTGSSTTFKVNGKSFTLPNYHKQFNAAVGYTMGCEDFYGYCSHSTATFSQVQFLNNGSWVDWSYGWGYAVEDKRAEPYGIYTRNPLSAYLQK